MFRNMFMKLFPRQQRLLGRWDMNYTKEHEIYLSNTFLLRDEVDTVNIKHQIILPQV